MNVLYIEDDADDCDLFTAALAQLDLPHPVNCIIATDGDEALAKLIDFPQNPDLIFLDINMPRMDGRELIQEVRKNPKLREIPIVIYSTGINSLEVEFFNRHGIFTFFTKPRDFNQLVNSLRTIFSSKNFLVTQV